MAIHVPGLMAIIVFYLLIVFVGVWASRKSKQSGATADSEDVMLAGRNIGLIIGIFTMTAKHAVSKALALVHDSALRTGVELRLSALRFHTSHDPGLRAMFTVTTSSRQRLTLL
ncbi:high-affinity choline transporter 1 [Elysia marginata]|uniref:High-affinity choline transporter 1 n=1 Tax=Elysia marginata TaxID=1093978 RepID=A0AAV4EDJ9_9GAST|nr:high-affinity choline transporter 1 [Elysia marginata]